MDNKNQEKKDNRKRKGRKFIFTVFFVLVMLAFTFFIAYEFGIAHHESLIWVSSGAIWSWIASDIFDRQTQRTVSRDIQEDIQRKLKTVASNLEEIGKH